MILCFQTALTFQSGDEEKVEPFLNVCNDAVSVIF